MAAPTVVSTSPVDGEVTFDGKRNSLSATLSRALLGSSVNQATVYLYEATSGAAVECDITLSTSTLIITAIPKSPLRENTNYVWSLVGSDLGAPGGYIQSAEGDGLATSYIVTFRTTEERFVSREEILTRDDVERIGPIRSVEDEAEAAGYIAPTSYLPAAFATAQSRSLDTIEVDFGETVLTTGSGAALTLTMQQAYGMTRDYGQQDSTGKFLMRDVEGQTPSRVAMFGDPAGTVSFSGTKIIWTKSSSYTWPYNAEIAVRIHSDRIVNSGGLTMAEDLYFLFTTEYWPAYISPLTIRVELGPAISQLYDDTIYRHISKNSIRAILESADNMSPVSDRDYPYANVEKFVKAQTIIDVVGELRLLADIYANQRKQLGDLSIQYSASDPMLSIRLRESIKDRDRALRELRRYRGLGGPLSAVKSENYLGERLDYRTRSWDSLVVNGSPTANTRADREAKAGLRTDHIQLSERSARVAISDDEEIFVSRAGGASVIKW